MRETSLAKKDPSGRFPLPLEFSVRVPPSQIRECFEGQRDVTVLDRWPRADEPRRWFIACARPDGALRLRIAPEQLDRPALGHARTPVDLELRVVATPDGDGSAVVAHFVPVFTASFWAWLVFRGGPIIMASWLILGPLGVPLGIAAFLGMVWPSRLRDDAQQLRNKVSAALGPVLAQDDAAAIYR